MLRKVYSSKEPVLNLLIEVTLTDVNSEYLAASNIEPVRLANKQIDPVAFQEYEDFVENVLNLLVTYNMNVMELKPSPKSETSWYTWFCPVALNGSVKSEVVFKLRISDRYKLLKTKSGNQRFKVMNVVVNNETFESYDEALDYVDKLFLDNFYTNFKSCKDFRGC